MSNVVNIATTGVEVAETEEEGASISMSEEGRGVAMHISYMSLECEVGDERMGEIAYCAREVVKGARKLPSLLQEGMKMATVH